MEIQLEFSPYASYQRKIIDSKCRYTITEASTKVGKTYSHIVWLLTKAVEEGELGRNYWWVAPVSSQAEIAFDRMERYLGVLINRRLVKTNKSKLYIQLWHGARIWFKSADKPDSLYGEDVYAAVFDEFTRAKPAAWYALRSTITKTEAPVKFIGNKTNPNHWGSKLVGDVEKGNMGADWEYHCITAWDAVDEGILSRDEILAAQRELPDDIFASLYLVKWIEVNGNPFWRHIDLSKVVRPVSYDPTLAVYLSFDYNKRNSCLVAQRTGRERRYLEEYYMLGGDGEDLEALVQEICFKYRHNIIYVTGDASGRAGSAFTSGNASGRMLLEMYFERFKAEWVYFDHYPTSNPEHVNSRLICNALTKNLDVVIDPGCVTLISDIRRVKTTVEGGMDKADMNKEDYGHCFVAGTMVETIHGPKPIETIKEGELVLTRKGYKKVLASGITNPLAKVRDYVIDGRLITCTDDHPIYTKNRGFIAAKDLIVSDMFCIFNKQNIEQWRKKQLSITGLNLTAIHQAQRVVTGCILKVMFKLMGHGERKVYTDIFTSVKLDQSPKNTTYTTLMEIAQIMWWRISKLLLPRHTRNITMNYAQNFKKDRQRQVKKVGRQQKSGTGQTREGRGTFNTQRTFSQIPQESQSNANVVAMNSMPYQSESFVPINARQSTEEYINLITLTLYAAIVKSLSEPANIIPRNAVPELALGGSERYATVYDLTVEGEPEFYANGALVHNCNDCFRYDLMNFDFETFTQLGYAS